MKNLIALILGVMMLAGCGSAASNATDSPSAISEATAEPTAEPTLEDPDAKWVGTWEGYGIESEGSLFTVEELEGLGDDSASGMLLIVKKGTKAYLSQESYGTERLVNYEIDGDVMTLNGNIECTLDEEGRMRMAKSSGKDAYIIMEKTSDSQTIPAKDDAEPTEEPTEAEAIEEPAESDTESNQEETDGEYDIDAMTKEEMIEFIDELYDLAEEYYELAAEWNENQDDRDLYAEYREIYKAYWDLMDVYFDLMDSDPPEDVIEYGHEMILKISDLQEKYQ